MKTGYFNNKFTLMGVLLMAVLVVHQSNVSATPISIKGRFGNDFSGVSGLAGGFFRGTFEVSGLPAQPNNNLLLSNIDVDLFDSQGQLFTILTFVGVLTANRSSNLGIDIVGLAEGGDGLQLDFSTPYRGNGLIIPTDAARYDGFLSEVITPNGKAAIVSGSSTIIPEPTTLALVGTGGVMLGLGYISRRRRGSIT